MSITETESKVKDTATSFASLRREAALEVHKHLSQAADTKRLMEVIELRVTMAVTGETNPDGKPAYSNDTARRAQVEYVLASNTDYQSHSDYREECLNKAALATIEREYYRDMFEVALKAGC